MAPKLSKKPAAAPAARLAKKPAARSAARSRSPRVAASPAIPTELQGLRAYIVNLERRPDRWERVSKMLKKETPWLPFEKFAASDGSKNPIPESEVAVKWNTKDNAQFGDFFEWVYDAPGIDIDGKTWKWAADAVTEDDEWRFTENGDEEWSYVDHAPNFDEAPVRTGTLTKKSTSETFKVKLQFAKRFVDPGEEQLMSGGERGCAHSHLRLWRLAAERAEHTLVLEDDVHLTFERSDADLGTMNGKIFTERLALAMKHAPNDFDVIYLGWSGWRGGHFKFWKEDPDIDVKRKSFIQKSEYVWTTVAYVITQAGAKKLLEAAKCSVNQPVDNFMAWEASQGRLNSYVALDAGDKDCTWAGGIVDQFDFQGDSDIQKSDGGVQGDDVKDFAAAK